MQKSVRTATESFTNDYFRGDYMSELIPVVKDENNELPVPSCWRNTFFEIVEAFKAGDYALERKVEGVLQISSEDADAIEHSICEYGDQVISLPDETWQSSVSLWMNGYWQVLVDLYTSNGGRSDLVLGVRVHEKDSAYVFEVRYVHVP